MARSDRYISLFCLMHNLVSSCEFCHFKTLVSVWSWYSLVCAECEKQKENEKPATNLMTRFPLLGNVSQVRVAWKACFVLPQMSLFW